MKLQKPKAMRKGVSINMDETPLPVTHHHQYVKSKTLELSAAQELKGNISNSSTHDDLMQLDLNLKQKISMYPYVDTNYLINERIHNFQLLLNPPSRLLVIFDLDETLIYNSAREYPNHSPIIFPRPYYYEMFSKISEFYEIWVWSASERHYIDAILKNMDPTRAFIKKVLCREDCTVSKENYLIKDIGRFSNLDLSQVVIVDNVALSYILNLENGLLVSSYNGSHNDIELVNITGILMAARYEPDIRTALKKYRI
jgi:TFIIF-interacting CTD phosphatase-like protein